MAPLRGWKGANTSYLQNIQKACHQHPSLHLLKTLSPVPEHPSRIKILEFTDKNSIADIDIHTLPELGEYWENHLSSPSKCRGRLYLVEDISLPWISALGNRFNIDPRFFAEYLKLDLDRTQHLISGYHTMRRLPSLRSKATFATLVYHEIRTFDGVAPRREEHEILTNDNVARLVTTVDHHYCQSTGLIRRNLGVWWRPRSGTDDEAWDAIILVDPGPSSSFHTRRWNDGEDSPWSTTSCRNTPYLDGYLDFSTWPPRPEASQYKQSFVQYANMLDDIVHYWHHASPIEREAALENPREAFIFAYRIIASHWNLQLEYLVSVVSDLEKGLLKFEQMGATPRAEMIVDEVRAMRMLLSDVNSWRRRVYFYLEQMRWNTEGVGPPELATTLMSSIIGDGASTGSEDDSESSATQTHAHYGSHFKSTACMHTHADFAPLVVGLRLTQQRIQSLLPVVMGAFSLLEAQHSVLKADLTIRLSSIALIFVPLSFTASLLSMSDDFLPGRGLFWVYWAISSPLILGLFWWAYWVQMGEVKRVGAREVARRLVGRGRGRVVEEGR